MPDTSQGALAADGAPGAPSALRVESLHVYPVKSCRGWSCDQVRLDARGIVGDRRYMIVDARGMFVSQREEHRLALIAPTLLPNGVRLDAPGSGAVDIAVPAGGRRRPVTVWNDAFEAIDQGEAARDWLSRVLGAPYSLVRFADDVVRRVDPTFASSNDDEVGFADGYPILLTTTASLDELNARLAVPVPMNRFRPNVVVSGATPFAEDGWRGVAIGAVRARVVKPCARCVITTVDQESAQGGREPLRTLATFRRGANGGVMFGQNVIHQSTGCMRVGDRVTLLTD